MKKGKTVEIDFGYKRLGDLADKYYNEGKLLSALRLAHRQYETYGGDGEVYTRLSDIYEGMGLHSSAINWWYRFLDIAEEEDLPDIYEGLAVNYLNMGQENFSAYYYNKLIDADETLPEETKIDIIDAFSKAKGSQLRFTYPPELADYSKELDRGSRALKAGDCKRAIELLDKVSKGSKQYAQAKEMQSVAYLLAGEMELAEQACNELLAENPDDVRVLATLAAVYLEQGKQEESRALAQRLATLDPEDSEELYKIATVCCENGMDEAAYQKFKRLEEKMPYDGRMLYFKAVAAFKSGRVQEAEKTFDTLCTIYPDAEVAKYYLKGLRRRAQNSENDETQTTSQTEETEEEETTYEEPTYFYHLPQEEREERCRALIQIGEAPKEEAQLFGLLALHDGYFRWCFDEMDGGDHELQFLGLMTAEHVRADEFIREAMLDNEVADVLKVETLRVLYRRNEDMVLGLVLCHIYRRIYVSRIKIGRKKRNVFIDAYAKIASRFVVLNEAYGKKIKVAAESLYRALEANERLDLIKNSDDCACAIFLLTGLKELGRDVAAIAAAFDADQDKVSEIVGAATPQNKAAQMMAQENTNEENTK